MKSTIAVIRPDGTVRKIYDKEFDDELGLTHRRASHVEPVNPAFRVLFHFVRSRCTDDSKLAAWTRKWPCRWRARIFDGPVLGPFSRRSDAIGAEIRFLEQRFIKGE
jgi:hypothetical protein